MISVDFFLIFFKPKVRYLRSDNDMCAGPAGRPAHPQRSRMHSRAQIPRLPAQSRALCPNILRSRASPDAVKSVPRTESRAPPNPRRYYGELKPHARNDIFFGSFNRNKRRLQNNIRHEFVCGMILGMERGAQTTNVRIR